MRLLKLRRFKLTILFMVTLEILIVGCGSQQATNEAPLTRAYRLIDAQRDDEAIEYLNKIIQNEPNQDYQVALASAYAHKAGVKIQKFASLVGDSKKISELPQELQFSDNKEKETTYKVDDFANALSGLLIKFSKVLTVYAAIPSVNSADSMYLEEAIKIMDSIEKPRPSDGIYRVILRVVQFKHFVAQEMVGPIGNGHQTANGCVLDLKSINYSVVKLGRILVNILDDLTLAIPSKAKELAGQRAQIADKTFSLTLVVTGTSVAGEASNAFIKHIVVEESFGKLLKCKDGVTH